MAYRNLIAVQFKPAGKIYHFTIKEKMTVTVGDKVVVETERGPSLAEVVRLDYDRSGKKNVRCAVRKASPADLKEGRVKSADAERFVRKKIGRLRLNMKLLKVEVQFSGNKMVIYFSAPGRVDFRRLIKELASGLKLRVELKQVGPRNATKLLGGVGVCGREYCCSSFLREFLPVSTRMAKNQNLAINPNKVSGGCGRLLCCLKYENENYSEARKKLPERGSRVFVKTHNLHGIISKVDLLNETLFIENEDNTKRIAVKNDDIEVLEHYQEKKPVEQRAEDDEWGEDLELKDLL